MSICQTTGIDYFGAGLNKEQAEGLTVKTVNGVKIGFAGCNYVYLPDDCAAAEDHAGINMVYKMSDERTLAFLEKVKEYDTQCDVLIVFMHAGTEEVFEVNSYQKNLARALVDNGADIVVGAHPHTLQPIEFYNGKPIFYSIGNLIFWHIDDDIDGLTCIFDITVDKNGFKSLKLHPLFYQELQGLLSRTRRGQVCLTLWADNRSDEQALQAKWNRVYRGWRHGERVWLALIAFCKSENESER